MNPVQNDHVIDIASGTGDHSKAFSEEPNFTGCKTASSQIKIC